MEDVTDKLGFDVSGIQAYSINNNRVTFIKPRPRSKK
jgi:hypothetical protein